MKNNKWYTPSETETQMVRKACITAAYKALEPIASCDDPMELTNSEVTKYILQAFLDAGYAGSDQQKKIRLDHPEHGDFIHTVRIEIDSIVLTAFHAVILEAPLDDFINIKHDLSIGAFLIKSLINVCKSLDSFNNIYKLMGDDNCDEIMGYHSKDVMKISKALDE
jgi:hypothetical protein